MKKLIAMVLCVGMLFGATAIKGNAQVIQKGSKTYITLDKTEKEENSLVLKEVFKIKNFKVSTTKSTYTVKYKSSKNAKSTKKQVQQVAEKLHGVNIEKKFKEYRTYKIKVIAVDKQGKTHSKTISGHKIK